MEMILIQSMYTKHILYLKDDGISKSQDCLSSSQRPERCGISHGEKPSQLKDVVWYVVRASHPIPTHDDLNKN